jgi:cytoskeleton protein RodZ
VSPAPAQPERAAAAAADTPVEINSRQQEEPANAVVAPATSPAESVSMTETARDTAAATAGPSAESETVVTTTIPAPAMPVPVTATSVPDAAQIAILPMSPPDAVGPEPASRVVLRATAISWVELRDATGKRVFSRLLKKGETYNVPGRSGITLATGNAGALDILVDGQTIGPLGPVGAVRRDVLLEPAALLQRGNARQ